MLWAGAVGAVGVAVGYWGTAEVGAVKVVGGAVGVGMVAAGVEVDPDQELSSASSASSSASSVEAGCGPVLAIG